MGRVNDFGLAVLAADLADAAALTGTRPDDWQDAQRALSAWVAEAGPESDARLVQHFHNWLQRQAFLPARHGSIGVYLRRRSATYSRAMSRLAAAEPDHGQ